MRIVKDVFDNLLYYEFIEDYTIKVFKKSKNGMFYSQIVYETDTDANMIKDFKYFDNVNEAKQKAIDYVNTLLSVSDTDR